MTIVSNTSPISNLAKVGYLDLLQQLYGTVIIPTAVHRELLDERAGATVISAVRAATWLVVTPVRDREPIDILRGSLNLGEAEAIALAIEVNATRLLIDERLGRQAATRRGLKITGVFGILLAAKQEGLLAEVKPVMDNLISIANFRVSSRLYSDILTAANE